MPCIGRIDPQPGFFPRCLITWLSCVLAGVTAAELNETALAVHADMTLHARMALVALLGLVHFRIAFLLLVLGRGWGSDDGRVNNGAPRRLSILVRR